MDVNLALPVPEAIFPSTSDCAAQLAAGASCHVSFQFVPQSAGPQSELTGGTFNGQGFTLFLKGNGINPVPDPHRPR